MKTKFGVDLLIFASMCVILLSSCGNNPPVEIPSEVTSSSDASSVPHLKSKFIEPGYDMPVGDISKAKKLNYKIEEWNNKKVQATEPMGMCRFNDDIVICDFGAHNIIVFNTKTKNVKTIGKLGSGDDEFVEPTAVTVLKDKLYVLDAGNSRVKIYNDKYELQSIKKLEPLAHHQGGFRYNDIEVTDNEDMFISCNAVIDVDAHIIKVSKDKITKLDVPFDGFLAKYDNTVYAANFFQLHFKPGVNVGESGSTFLYKIENDKLVTVAELPNKYSANDLIIEEKSAIILSALWGNLMEFDLDGKLKYDYATFENQEPKMYLLRLDEKSFLVSNPNNGKLYQVSK